MPDQDSFDTLLAEAEARPVIGWDFSWLGDRLSFSPLPWDYEHLVLTHARGAPDLLDMGTGGGERLAAMTYRAPRTVATEGWAPNVDVAGARLRPLGVTVVAVEGAPDNVDQTADETRGHLPFPSESFTLVINRHESFVAREVARVLAPGGVFVTQQLGGDYTEFYEALGRSPPRRITWDLRLAAEQVGAAGLRIVDRAEAFETIAFADIGAFAWYLNAAPWTIEGFSIATHRPQLERLHARIRSDGPIQVHQPAFQLQAVKDRAEP